MDGGGYPAAGIGGGGAGGAGGDPGGAGGGFSAGSGEASTIIFPGAEGRYSGTGWGNTGSSGYYRFYCDNGECAGSFDCFQFALGGHHTAGTAWRGFNGGSAGKGGTIKVSESAHIYAYNGYFKQNDVINTTTETTECVIYAQLGYSLDALNADTVEVQMSTTGNYGKFNNGKLRVAKVNDLLAYANNASGMITKLGNNYRTINYSTYTNYGKIGIGSGAGLHEFSNGTYEEMANENLKAYIDSL